MPIFRYLNIASKKIDLGRFITPIKLNENRNV